MNTKEKIISGLAGVIVIAGVALASTGLLSSNKNPEEVFNKIVTANAAVTSSRIDLVMRGNFSGGSMPSPAQFSMQVSGVTTKSETSANADMHFIASGNEGSRTDFSVEGDFRLLDRMFYLRATKIPPIPFIDPALVVNKWFSLDPVSIYKDFGDAKKAAELEQAISFGSKMPKEFTQESYALAVQEGVVSAINPKGNEVVSGVTTQKYEISIATAKIPVYLVKYTKLYNKYAVQTGLDPLPQRTMSEDDLAVFETMKFSPISVWIGKSDMLPYKFAFTLTIEDVDSPVAVAKATSGTISIEATMSDYNKAVMVEKPAGVMPIQDLFKSLMGGL